MSWEEDVRWARICRENHGEPWKQLRFFQAAFILSLLMNCGLIVALIAMIMWTGRH